MRKIKELITDLEAIREAEKIPFLNSIKNSYEIAIKEYEIKKITIENKLIEAKLKAEVLSVNEGNLITDPPKFVQAILEQQNLIIELENRINEYEKTIAFLKDRQTEVL